MKRIVAGAALVLALVASTAALAAEQIVYLRDGSVLHASAISTSGDMVSVQTANGTLQIPQSNILRIEPAQSGSAAPTPPPPPPTPVPGENPQQPAQGSTQPREGWYRQGEAPHNQPDDLAPPQPPPPSTQVIMGRRRDPFVAAQLGLEGKAGIHVYAGNGWSRFGDTGTSGDSGTLGAFGLEALVRSGVQSDEHVRVDAVGSVGFYAGSRDCIAALDPCRPISAATFYGDGGMRLTLYGPPFYLYGQAGIGGAASSFSYGSVGGLNTDTNDGGTAFTQHLAGGAGLALDSFTLFGEIKYIHAPTDFGGYTLDMGGVTFSAGIGLSF